MQYLEICRGSKIFGHLKCHCIRLKSVIFGDKKQQLSLPFTQILFSNIESILEVHCEFLSTLDASLHPEPQAHHSLGQVFLKFVSPWDCILNHIWTSAFLIGNWFIMIFGLFGHANLSQCGIIPRILDLYAFTSSILSKYCQPRHYLPSLWSF